MPVFAGLVTYLALSATPGLPPGDYAKTPAQSARPDSGTFTGIGLHGAPGHAWAAFSG